LPSGEAFFVPNDFCYFCKQLKTVQRTNISKEWIAKAISYADEHFNYFSYHQDNDTPYPHNGYRHLLAIGAEQTLQSPPNGLADLGPFSQDQWCFGYLGYDLKNELHDLSSVNEDHLLFPDLNFFNPSYVIEFHKDEAHLLLGDDDILEKINAHRIPNHSFQFGRPSPEFQKQAYIDTVHRLIEHIVEGDFYEINFCQGFFGEFKAVDLTSLYMRLNELSPKPFSCLQKFNEHAIVCASPERFLKRVGQQLISQPIKGTKPRGATAIEDEHLKVALRNDEKELAENMMIVDLVRNDLAKSSESGSVMVEEMFGIYSFKQVHQMISTITSTLRSDVSGLDAIANAFPMGSMTGAPKRKVMELTEVYEKSKRGAFSGAAGYFQPNGNFDFNVLIRSLFLNLATKKYGFHVGSAITYDALPENEYEECFVKAKALLELIGS